MAVYVKAEDISLVANDEENCLALQENTVVGVHHNKSKVTQVNPGDFTIDDSSTENEEDEDDLL